MQSSPLTAFSALYTPYLNFFSSFYIYEYIILNSLQSQSAIHIFHQKEKSAIHIKKKKKRKKEEGIFSLGKYKTVFPFSKVIQNNHESWDHI
jgi:hypothetical protein